MPALTTDTTPPASNPLDLMEQVIGGMGWTFDRCTPTEMAAEAPARWCDYGLFFSWSAELGTILFTCAFDLRADMARRGALYELIGLANEQMWVGHFSLDTEDGVLLFRHALLLRGTELAADIFEDMIDIALNECERFYPAFRFFLMEGLNTADAMAMALLDCQGEA
ncbi:YbjN domain-containing protein [Acetobacter sp. TBRC 12305]|uniref:YbjN domain-containing protein n=1 Tax=Acetobacter garciniae TaxID=2817435 RepID=A0A939HLU6_9PROT|nr:YbjN domain-containing protein [Acetobacter garciniae]MBO1324396.1 YbjN domain-containing protein [Acetobacter garciniae]MBX0344085.1 YbjN domain-containing protein [Acetobacter garciniae]